MTPRAVREQLFNLGFIVDGATAKRVFHSLNSYKTAYGVIGCRRDCSAIFTGFDVAESNERLRITAIYGI